MVVVEIKLRGVIKEHFPNLTVECVFVDIYFKTEFLERLGRCLPKFEKTMFARKPIGLQQNLVLAVMNYIAGEMLRFGMLAYVLIHGRTILQQIWRTRSRRTRPDSGLDRVRPAATSSSLHQMNSAE